MNITNLEEKIKKSYEQGVTMEEAERLAGEFLGAQIVVAEELREHDLNSRMRKSGLKALKAGVYLENALKDAKKPSDVLLQNIVDFDKLVQSEQRLFDEAEVERDYLQNIYSICKEAHIHFRGIAKGSFGG